MTSPTTNLLVSSQEGEQYTMAVIEWICDCCGAYQDQWDKHWTTPNGEDRCDECHAHTEHCHEYILVEGCARHATCIAGIQYDMSGNPTKVWSTKTPKNRPLHDRGDGFYLPNATASRDNGS